MLSLISRNTNPELLRSAVNSINACKIYFLTRERNAWHSTWIRRYSPGSIQLTFSGAASEAEKLRARGTNFIVQELPALRLSSRKGHLFVTDINSKCPLEHYWQDALYSGDADGRSLISDARNNYLVRGAPMIGAALSFRHDSRFWRRSPPPENHVLVLAAEETGLEFEPIPSREHLIPALWKWHSVSSGGSRPLEWSKSFFEPVNPDKVIELSKSDASGGSRAEPELVGVIPLPTRAVRSSRS